MRSPRDASRPNKTNTTAPPNYGIPPYHWRGGQALRRDAGRRTEVDKEGQVASHPHCRWALPGLSRSVRSPGVGRLRPERVTKRFSLLPFHSTSISIIPGVITLNNLNGTELGVSITNGASKLCSFTPLQKNKSRQTTKTHNVFNLIISPLILMASSAKKGDPKIHLFLNSLKTAESHLK